MWLPAGPHPVCASGSAPHTPQDVETETLSIVSDGFFKYPVIIDGRNFATRFGFEPERSLETIFRYYRESRYQS